MQLTSARAEDRQCPQFAAAKARPALWPDEPYKPRGLEMFPLGPVMEVLDAMEPADGGFPFPATGLNRALARLARPGRTRPVHPGLRRWAEHAVHEYLDVAEALAMVDGVPLRPVTTEWVVQHRRSGDTTRGTAIPADDADGVIYEVCAWGRRYASADGRVREIRLLRNNTVRSRKREMAEVATAAFVVAFGRPAPRPPFKEPYQLGDPTSASGPARVRVVEVGCTDGSFNVLFDGTPAQAQADYRQHARPALQEAAKGGEYRPGYRCVDCKLLTVCPAIPRHAGLLGVDDTSRPRRSWAVTTGRDWLRCAAKQHLRALNLPRQKDVEWGPSVRRGHAIHDVIGALHARRPIRACRPEEIPDDPATWESGEWTLDADEARTAIEMLRSHAEVCPLRGLAPDALVRVEQTLFVYDSAADVVLTAKPDLHYTDRGAPVLRELKTTTGYVDDRGPISRFPQIALGLVLLADGVLGGDAAGSRMELERLSVDGARLDVFDPGDFDQLAEARRVVALHAAGWHADSESYANPGSECRWCEVSRWCPQSAAPTP